MPSTTANWVPCSRNSKPAMHALFSKIKDPRLRVAVLVIYYAAITAAVIYLQTKGNYHTPPFIYQGF